MGHPQSSGIHSIDYYLTSDAFLGTTNLNTPLPTETNGASYLGWEIAGMAGPRFREQLVRMSTLGFFFLRQHHPMHRPIEMQSKDIHTKSTSLQDFMKKDENEKLAVLVSAAAAQAESECLSRSWTDLISEDSKRIGPSTNIYLCPQNMMKFHPRFDRMMKGVLQADPFGVIILIYNRKRHRLWRHTLLYRLRPRNTTENWHNRIILRPTMPHHALLCLMRRSNAVLDTFPFGGGVTTIDAFSQGAPVITFPARQTTLRFTHGLYTWMAKGDSRVSEVFKQLIVASEEEYVAAALRLGTNRSWLSMARNAINSRSHLLFEQKSVADEFGLLLSKLYRTNHAHTAN